MEYSINAKKRILSILLIAIISINLVFIDTKKVEAVVGIDDILLASITTLVGVVASIETSSDYQDFYDNQWRPKWRECIRQGLSVIGGIPIDPTYFDSKFQYLGPDPIQEIRKIISDKTGVPENEITDNQCKEFVYNMFDNSVVNEDNDSFSVSGDLNLVLHHFDNLFRQNLPMEYYYSFVVNSASLSFPSGDIYNAVKQKLLTTDNNYLNILYQRNSNYYLLVSNNTNLGLVYKRFWNPDIDIKFYDLTNWNEVNYVNSSSFTQYKFDTDTKQFVESNDSLTIQNDSSYPSVTKEINKPVRGLGTGWGGIAYIVNRTDSHIYKVYTTLEDLKLDSVGESSYYINNTVYNNWNNSTGDYIANSNNSNLATYGDINSYIDSFNTENNRYPSPEEIKIFIQDYEPTVNPTPTPNPDNPSGVGGGSIVNNNTPNITNNPIFNNNPNINVTLFPGLSGNGLNGGSVSGNGGNSEGGIGSLFGWLGDLGQVIGDLIKNLGEAIKNIVKGISDLITSIVTDLPTMFFDFIGAFFGWMPPEWSTLLSLSLASMLIFGIIKIFRG